MVLWDGHGVGSGPGGLRPKSGALDADLHLAYCAAAPSNSRRELGCLYRRVGAIAGGRLFARMTKADGSEDVTRGLRRSVPFGFLGRSDQRLPKESLQAIQFEPKSLTKRSLKNPHRILNT